MSNFKEKQQVRPESKVKVIGEVAQGLGGRSKNAVGIVGLFAAASMPDASAHPDGVLAYNTTTSKLQITVSGSWVNVA